ncbi:hypothetical protein THAPSDRAFT_269710 [Thalassiosira pseudonana CCMP1335]|uniref:Dihydropteridine reductase n=1 Tax=Thalassiosira pseudonana TaxID=35128 RepID=B8CBV4_THAPS|nr:hypothetical protein THAPSDRAFT_269710 [Thalassiosira pseudonana CCMP1335]EED89386.1 hypothetical protein THAPSDRAFT_269710 [Thalassiosira pseudonana CCMP1335]
MNQMKTAMSSSAAVSIVKRSSVMASNIILSGSHAVCTTSVGVDVVGSSSSTNYRFFASSSFQFNGIHQRSGLLRANARGSACHSLHKHELINLQPSSVHLQQQQQTRHFAQGGTHKRKKNRTPNNGSSSSRDGDHFDKYSFDDVDSKPKEAKKNVLVIGSSGVLGRTLVSHFGNSFQWNVLGADVVDPSEDNDDNGSMADLTEELFKGVQSKNRSKKLDAIVCASGGWMEDVLMGDVSAEVVERMMRVNFYPIVAGSLVGSRFMNRGGLFVAIGASAALSPTPGMIGYGSSKSATHHYLQSLGGDDSNMTSVGILPLMLDTAANRAMVGGDEGDGFGSNNNDERYSRLVKPIQIVNEIGEWIKNPHLRPHSGSLVKVIAKNRKDGSGGAAFHLVR